MYMDLAILAGFVFLYSVVAGGVERTPISGPIVFLLFGLVLGPGALSVAEAYHAVGHEQNDRDEHDARDPKRDDDRGVYEPPIRRDRGPPPRTPEVEYHGANSHEDQHERDKHDQIRPKIDNAGGELRITPSSGLAHIRPLSNLVESVRNGSFPVLGPDPFRLVENAPDTENLR